MEYYDYTDDDYRRDFGFEDEAFCPFCLQPVEPNFQGIAHCGLCKELVAPEVEN